jgi:hypothetical protein
MDWKTFALKTAQVKALNVESVPSLLGCRVQGLGSEWGWIQIGEVGKSQIAYGGRFRGGLWLVDTIQISRCIEDFNHSIFVE